MRNFNLFTSPFFGDSEFNGFPRMRIHKHGVPTMPSPAVPPVNIAEGADGFTIEMAAPGYQKADFKVNIDKNLLTISVEKEAQAQETDNAQKPQEEKKVYRREFCYGNFSRSFTLPDGIDSSRISGSYENGILTLSIPKAEVHETKMAVEIK